MTALILSTAFQLIVLAACGFFAWRANVDAKTAQHSAQRLATARGQLTTHEAQLEALDTRIRKLSGVVYRERREDPRPDNYPPSLPLGNAQGAPMCENFVIAQDPADPRWRQARACECAYCATQRHARGVEKAAILAERARAKANGSE